MYDRYTGRKGVALEDLMDEDWKPHLPYTREMSQKVLRCIFKR